MKRIWTLFMIFLIGITLYADNYIDLLVPEKMKIYEENLRISQFNTSRKLDRTIKIGTDNHLPPYSYVNDNGIFKGFYIDIMRAISIEIGIDVEVYPMPWHEVERYLNKGEIHGVLGMSIDNHSPSLTMTQPLLNSSDAIFVRRDNKYIVNLEDLKNVKVAIQRGKNNSNVLIYLDQDNIIYADNQQQGIQMMMMGQVDAFIGDKLSGLYTIQKWKQENFIKVVGEPINEKSYGIGVSQEDGEIKNLFNKGFEIIKANGTYDKIYKKWFGETINSDARWIKRVLVILGILLIIVLVTTLFFMKWNNALKKEVKKRTNELSIANSQLIDQKEQLENNDKFKEEILNSLLSGIVTFNRDQIITFMNTQGGEILNISAKNILGENIDRTIFSKFFDHLNLADVLDKGEYYRGHEIEMAFDNGTKTFNCNLYPLKEKNENIYGGILNFRDISEDKKIKVELARKDRMQALGLMIAGLAHEIRNPLTSIKALVDLIPYKLDNLNFRNKFMEIVPSEINRLSSLITDLLEYSKPKGFSREMIHVKKIFYNINILFSKHFQDKQISFVVDIDEDLIIFADKHQIKQVFINLILNSIESIENGGNITISGRKTQIFTEIIIEDDGQGISKENIEKILDPFFTTKSNGTGLGLFICYQIILENQGYIHIDSKLGEGTRVIIKLLSEMIGSVNNEQYLDC